MNEYGNLYNRYEYHHNKTDYSKYAKYIKGSYYDSTVAATASLYFSNVGSELKKASNKNLSTLKKIELVEGIYEQAKTEISKKYASVLAKAKTKAAEKAKALFNDGDKVTYDDGTLSKENSTKLYQAAKAEISNATSLEGLSAIVDETDKYTYDEDSLTYVGRMGSYNETERLRAEAYSELADSLEGIGEEALQNDDEKHITAYNQYKEILAGFGVTNLPLDVYKEYLDKVNNAESFDYYVDEKGKTNYSETSLGQDAIEDVSNSYKNIISTLRESIKASYDEEIYTSKVLTAQKDRDNFSTYVENAIANWFHEEENPSIADILSYNYYGLYGAIEAELDGKNEEFTKERLENYKEKVVAALKSAYNKILDNDTVYKAIIEMEGTGVNGTVDSTDYSRIDNQYGLASGTTQALYQDTKFNYSSDDQGAGGYYHSNLEKALEALLGKELDAEEEGYLYDEDDSIGDMYAAYQYGVRYLNKCYGGLNSYYSQSCAVKIFKRCNDVNFNDEYDGSVINASDLTDAYNALFVTDSGTAKEKVLAKTCDDVLEIVKDHSNWIDDIEDLSEKYGKWLEDFKVLKKKDSELLNHKNDSNSKVWAAVQSQVKKILNGETTGSATNGTVIKSLDALYTQDVAAELASKVSILSDMKTGLVTSALADTTNGTRIAENINSIYAALTSAKSGKEFKFTIGDGEEQTVASEYGKTYDGVKNFYEAAVKILNATKDGKTTIKIGTKTFNAVVTD